MRFVFKCLAVRHAGGRVTVTPLDFPALAVHATTVARAVEELTLALDDRIARAHPRRLVEFARPAAGEAVELAVPAIKVWGAEKEEVRPMRVTAVVAPAHRPYTEVRAPRLEARFWFAGKQITDAAVELLAGQLDGASEDAILALRSEGGEALMDLTVEVTPLRLADLKRSELTLDERPPPRPPEQGRDPDDDDDDEAVAGVDDDWDDDAKQRRKRRAAARLKPPKRPPTPTLRSIGSPWHELAREGSLEPAFERDALVEELRARLGAKQPDPIVLVGPPGAGKTAVLHELARRLAAEAARPEDARPFFFVDGSRLIAGQGGFGDWQRQVLDVLSEAHKAGAILCLGHLIDLLDAGKTAHSEQNVAQLLGPALSARESAVIAEATTEEWARIERRNQSFARAFAIVRVEDPAPDACARLLARVGEALAEEHELAIDAGAIAETLSLCARFLPYGALVGNAVSMLRRLAASRAHALAKKVVAGDALELFSAESGIPPILLRDDEPLDEADVRAFLAARVHGQQAAVARVAQVVTVIKANLADRRRPSAVLLFAGPTGVGKTELCKALAEFVFGARERLVRLDMSEYAGPDALARLIGDGRTPGYLAAALRRQPFSVVLLDEIEKAHPAVFDALLGVLGEGRLTDAGGKFTDFRSSVIVMTSNLGAESWRARPGFGGGGAAAAAADMLVHYRSEAQRFFRPELYNRLDDVVVFAPLGAPEIRSIVEREVARVCGREGLRRRDVDLVVGEGALDLLAARGLDPRYGARPLKRTLERELVAPVATWLAEHPPGGATRLTVGDGLQLAAETLGGATEGVGRAQIVKVLQRAAGLRAEVRRWSRSRPMVRLQQELALFDRLSRQPAFWADRVLADERARAAAEGRELTAAFAQAERQAEAAEDLAYEAYYARQVAAAESLGSELDGVEAGLQPLGERLFGSLFPPRQAVALELVAGRAAWGHLCWLVDGYAAWIKARGGSVSTYVAVKKEKKEEKKATPGTAAAKKIKKEKEKVEWKWHSRAVQEDDAQAPAAAILYAGGIRALMLLAAEHGTHRFTSGGQTSVVKVRFEPRPGVASMLPAVDVLEERMPAEEIRRIWPDKKRIRDLRTELEFDLGARGELELAPVLKSYLAWRVFSAEDELE